MEGILKQATSLLSRKTLAEEKSNSDNQKLIDDIRQVTERLENLQTTYDLAEDGELIESLIYEELALKAKYAWLLKKAKENETRAFV